MKRKVVKHGPSTLIISLPNKWVKEYDIKKGDELEVLEENNKITIMAHTEKKHESFSIKISDYTDNTIQRIIAGAYKIGYDEIRIHVDTPESHSFTVETINNQLIGFEVLEENSQMIVARQITSLGENEFKDMLRRTFLFVMSVADDSLVATKANDFPKINSIPVRDITINKLTNFCRRYLNKRSVPEFKNHTNTLYSIIESLEKIGDEYRDISQYIGKNNIKISADTVAMYEAVNRLFHSLYDLFYGYSCEKLDAFIKERKKINEDIIKYITTCPKNDRIVVIQLFNALSKIFDMNGPVLTTML